MKRLTPLLIPLLLSACSESGVKAYNVDPVAEIISHADGAEVLEGYVETFRGAVSDANHGASNLTATWYLDGDVLCEGAAPDATGITECAQALPSTASEISLEVQDPANAAASDHISIVLIPTDSPEAEILSPDGSSIYYSDQLIVFEGVVSDSEDAAADLELLQSMPHHLEPSAAFPHRASCPA